MRSIYHHSEIGSVELCSNNRCRGIKYSVLPNKVRISFNPIYSDQIIPIPQDKVEWILKSKAKISKSYDNKISPTDIIETLTFRIIFQKESKLKDNISGKLCDNILVIRYGENFDFENTNSQKAVKNIIKYFLKKEARVLLPRKLEYLSRKYNFQYSNLRISSAKSRWGSCSSKQNISLSIYLLILPERLIDLVIIHELCHTLHMNHGEKFYDLMAKIIPDHKQLSEELKLASRKLLYKLTY